MRFFVFFSVLCMLLGVVAGYQGNSGEIARRDDTTAAESATTGDAASTTEAPATATDSDTASVTDATESASQSDATTGTNTNTHTATGTASNTKSSSSNSTSIDPRMGVGGISMLTPTQGATSYYKIGEKVTFAWNYTSLAVTPSAVNVVASCSMNDATYTISNNMSVAETGKVTWDTGKYQANATVPLLTATYTLVVYDVDGEIGDTASAGRLGSQNQFSFGMYVPQAYTPLNEYKCATCNGALPELDGHAVRFAMGMVTLTVLSFTWFAGGYGVFAV
ncbi:uncharacterized protein ASPGLDRAFT_170668 [Aspergillus glaucus CBS 516.65]|uniref:DUF7137 domain-containing protein n=1 Tax=Aspergillus glaucus CBS 516.65 TaxID=1160497 RepID=A0A1L9VLH4_ASPGL|nr:hypothetical protein ASPGLDRAFT_170668 [Aspergillus glaucus CBS 516.65]OJJ84744.1 hypothetical protein ASPGLDRAFT_170668 [Aspergillus glaucus CBS 516.65]